MPEMKPLTIPPFLLVLDILGAILLGLGLAKYFAGTDLLPEAWRFEGYGPVLIGVGFALMLPLLAHIIKVANSRAPGGRKL